MSDERIVDKVLKEAGVIKTAKIFDVDEIVVCVDQVQGLNKGSLYKVTKTSKPGLITIASFDPSTEETIIEVGEFPVDRFVKWNDEY